MQNLKPNQKLKPKRALKTKRKRLHFVPFAITLILVACSTSPKITSFSPDYGPSGTEVTVKGKNLVKSGDLSQTRIELNGVIQPNVSGNATELKFSVQEGALPGKIKVVASGKSGTSTEYFDVVEDFNGNEDEYTFGGLNAQAAKVSPSGNDQEVLFGIMRTKWTSSTGGFNTFKPLVDSGFAEMNEFWTEASFGEASFSKRYLTNSIINLPKSKNYYYHRAQQRDIKSCFVDNSIDLPSAKRLTVQYGAGLSFNVDFPSGNLTRNAIADSVNNAIGKISGTPPTFNFRITGNRLQFRSTLNGKREEKINLTGTALPHLGFGSSTFYNLPDEHAVKLFFGNPIEAVDINFPTVATLQITTLGDTTNVNFPAGSTHSVNQIITRIQGAFPGVANQQPYVIEQITDPLDADKRILVFKTRRDADNDHGFEMTIGGSAATLLGLSTPGQINKYEKETFRGRTAVSDGFNVHAASLPAGTNLDNIFASARMFVGLLADDNQLRAHHSSHTFAIQDENYEANYFVARSSDIGPFAHETGHALGLPDLYDVSGTKAGTVPNNWDIMDCSRCDVHPVQWLKSRRHKEPEHQDGSWTKGAHIASLSPPAAMTNDSHEFIISPAESPWISANPFSASHPGIQVVHAVELIPTDPKDVFFLENRQPGPYQANHLGNQVDFSTQMPGEGVIMYQGRRIPTAGLIDFLPVNLLSPYNNPLNTNGETFEHVITGLNRINVEVVDKILNPDASGGPQSFSYHIRITWGQGSFYDLAIREWNPRPWESEDIWIDNRAENDWDVYTYDDADGNPILNGDNVAVNVPNRLYAKVRNLGDVDVTQDFDVIWRIAVPQQVGGPIETEVGRVRVTEDVLGNNFIITPPLEWVPRNSNEQHICVKAEIVTVPGELNGTANNSAQENITQWFSGASSPFEPITVHFETRNPYDDRSEDFRINVPEIPSGWTVTVEDANFRLGPGEVKRQTATIRPIHGYFHDRGIIKKNEGIIPSLNVNIEAMVPLGDIWQTYGGITAVVHPVNNNSTITLRKENKTQKDGSIEIFGTTQSTGVLIPQLSNREINVRIRNENNPDDEKWFKTITRIDGSFQLIISKDIIQGGIKVQAFHSGGLGFKPASSNEITLR